MKKENIPKFVFDLLEIYDLSVKRGILYVKDMLLTAQDDFLAYLSKIMFRCLTKNIDIQQIHEILTNYAMADKLHNEIEKRIMIDTLLCIISGESKSYLVELQASLLNVDPELLCVESDETCVQREAQYFTTKEYYSEKTKKLENIDKLGDELILQGIHSLRNEELVLALYGASGRIIERIVSILDESLAQAILEDLICIDEKNVDENRIIDAQSKILDLLECNK